MNEITQDHLLITRGPRKGEKISLADVPIVIGQDESARVRIDLEGISKTHAAISSVDNGYLLEDLNSESGTFVNKRRIQRPHRLINGDVIALGDGFEMEAVIQKANVAVIAHSSTEEPSSKATVIAPSTGAKEQATNNATVIAHSSGGREQDPNKATVMARSGPKEKAPNKATVMMRQGESLPEIPPRLVVNESGKEPKLHTLTASRLRIGRNPDNDIVIDNQFVSRYHAELEKRGASYYILPSANVSNPLLLDGRPVMEATLLQHGAKIRLGGFAPGEMASIDYLSPDTEATNQKIAFTENHLMTIGRNPNNDIVLSSPTVSQYHAEVEKVGQRYRVNDLRSSNGTFVNGQSISGETWVNRGDAIQIGPYRFVVAENDLSQSDQSESGVRVDIIGLNKWVSKDLNILQDISLVFQPKEFIVVVGQSGGGKSTLVDAIAGYRAATHGQVIVNNTIDVYREFDAIRSNIGYVPQKDIIHMELTVFQALDYAARLRMPRDTTPEERLKRIDEVMEDLDLAHRRNTQISQLSGGQQKRVSIGVELLTKPGLFFLDEPTSGLDPGMETELMRLMRRLADQGRTVVMITHATKNVMLADKVVFLARGGFLSWFGPPEEALTYFDEFRQERDRRSHQMEFDHIYTLLDDESLGSGADWAKRYKNSAAYQKYIAEPLTGKEKTQAASKEASKPLAQHKQSSALRQFFILSERNLKILTSDVFSMVLLLLIAPMMAALDFVLASGIGRNPTGFAEGNFNQFVVTLISITNTSVLVGGLAMMRELVKEREVYKRERRVNLQISSYIFSKAWIAFVLAIYQALCFTVIRYLAFEMPGTREDIFFFYITEFLLILAGTMVGLFCSALAPNANSAPLLLILFVIPQMVLSGALVQLPDAATRVASMRWAFQSFSVISGVGSDVAKDSCWTLTQEQQDDLTLDQKNAACPCMGENSLREDSCNFPGLGRYYTSALDTVDPVEPTEPGPQPEEPVFPPAPEQPGDPNDFFALQQYLQDLNTYNEEVDKMRDEYKEEIDAWQDEQDQYKTDSEAYQKEITELKVKRATAVGSAESTIRRFKEQYGWTFVNKDDRTAYLNTLMLTWIAEVIICIVLFVGTIFMQRRWESG